MEFRTLFGEKLTDDKPMMIAGPCSAESADKVMQCAEALYDMGISIFRAGLWKPRTRPGSFEGVGDRGLAWLRRVKMQTGMKVICEVGNAAHTSLAIKGGMDGIWIGARTVANPFAVQEIADELHRLGNTDITVLVKNPVNPDLDLWIGAIERLYKAGIRRLGAVHRGFSSYQPGRWRNPPQWAIPIELHHRLPNLPLLHDPSHCSGKAADVPQLAMQALKLCFNGLMVECHPAPESALSDAAQQLSLEQMRELMQQIRTCKPSSSNHEPLRELRSTIDALDTELLQILAKRMEACREIGNYKAEHGMAVVQPDRYAALLNEKIEQGIAYGLNPNFLHRIFADIHAASVELQMGLHSRQ